MPKYTWVVQTRCTPGKEAEFNAWYNDVHLPDLLRIPGVVGAYRAQLASVQKDPTMLERGWPFLSIYQLDTDDPQGVMDEVGKRSGTPEMIITPTLSEATTALYQDF